MTERPNWQAIYDGVAHNPDRDNDLVPVTRETLRLAASAIRSSQAREAYHTLAAAEVEIEAALRTPGLSKDEVARVIEDHFAYDAGGIIDGHDWSIDDGELKRQAATVARAILALLGQTGDGAVKVLQSELEWYSRTEHGALDGIPFKHVAHIIRVMLCRIAALPAPPAKEGR